MTAVAPAAPAAPPEAAPELPDYDPTGFWDEMFAAPGQVRTHYSPLAKRLAPLAHQAGSDVVRRGRHARAPVRRR